MNFPDTAQCKKGHTLHLVAPLGNLAAMAILGRAAMEMREGDWTLAIVLSATAIESQMAYAFMKWKKVDLIVTRNPTDADEELWEDEWKDVRSIGSRLEKVSQQLASLNFDAFCHQNGALLTDLHAKYPASQSGSLKDFFIKEFFWRRNRIVHFGRIDYEQADADLCFTSASTLWLILEKMDKQRQQTL
jgi:hypothetical protein